MKKVLVYINSMAPAGGIERVVANLVNVLVEENTLKIILLTKDNKKSFYDLKQKIEIRTLNNYLKMDLTKTKFVRALKNFENIIKGNIKLKNELKKIKPDYIYVTSPLEALEICLAKSPKNKLIISEHGSKFGYNKVYDIIKKIIYPKAYKVIVPSKMDTELYLKEGCLAEYIPHLNTFKSKKINDLKNKVVLNIGRYTNDKQQDLLIDIWNEVYLKNDIKDWKLHIVGKGENEKKLQNKINGYKLEECIKLFPPKKKVEEYLEKASIFAFTSKYEGFGMVLLEAMSFGIPCISFDCPSGPRDIVENEKNGYLVEDGDSVDYCKKLEYLMKNYEKREEFSKECIKKIEEWDNEKIIELWKNIFK